MPIFPAAGPSAVDAYELLKVKVRADILEFAVVREDVLNLAQKNPNRLIKQERSFMQRLGELEHDLFGNSLFFKH